jgi:hypothetical protein
MEWIGFFVGLFLGTNLGVFGLGLIISGRNKGNDCLNCPWFIESCGKFLNTGKKEE